MTSGAVQGKGGREGKSDYLVQPTTLAPAVQVCAAGITDSEGPQGPPERTRSLG